MISPHDGEPRDGMHIRRGVGGVELDSSDLSISAIPRSPCIVAFEPPSDGSKSKSVSCPDFNALSITDSGTRVVRSKVAQNSSVDLDAGEGQEEHYWITSVTIESH